MSDLPPSARLQAIQDQLNEIRLGGRSHAFYDEVQWLIDRLRAGERAPAWHPIETAPKENEE